MQQVIPVVQCKSIVVLMLPRHNDGDSRFELVYRLLVYSEISTT